MSNDDSAAVTESPKVFLSYRRDDSAGHAGRLFDQINNHFGDRVRIFMDVDAIAPGEDFVNVIESAVGACEVLIAVIGRDWLTATDQNGIRRLDNPEDFIRLEIATALNRNIRVIPVIVQGAVMPRRDQLPEPLANLSRRNAIELSDARWRYDVDRLIKVIEKVLSAQQPVRGKQQSDTNEPWRPRPWQIVALAIGVGVILSLVTWQLYSWAKSEADNRESKSSPTPVTSPEKTVVKETPSQPVNSPAPSTPSPAPLERQARIQVVRIGRGRGFFARGFFTNKGYVIAFGGEILKASDETTVQWSEGNRDYDEKAQVIQVKDWVALLKLNKGLLPGDTPIRNSSSLKEGEAVDRFINGNDKTPGVVVKVNVKGMKPTVLLTTKISAPGDAGAPVTDSQGRIVAMVLGGSAAETQSLPIEIIKVHFPEAF